MKEKEKLLCLILPYLTLPQLKINYRRNCTRPKWNKPQNILPHSLPPPPPPRPKTTSYIADSPSPLNPLDITSFVPYMLKVKPEAKI